MLRLPKPTFGSKVCYGISPARADELSRRSREDDLKPSINTSRMDSHGGKQRKLVRCIETGEVFPTASHAATIMRLGTETIRLAITNGTSAGGKNWEWA